MQFNRQHIDFRKPLVDVGRAEDFFFRALDVNLKQVDFVKTRFGKEFAYGRRPERGGVVCRRLERHEARHAKAFVFHANESFFAPQRRSYRVNVVVKRRVKLQQLEVVSFGLDGVNLRGRIFVGEVDRRTADIAAAVQNQFRRKIFNRRQLIFLSYKN